MSNVPEHSEFETKYKAKAEELIAFKSKAEGLVPNQFIYVQGWDYFFVKEGSPFIRVRVSDYKMDKTGQYYIQLTSKEKRDGAKNNILRKEINLQLDGNDKSTIFAFLQMIGYKQSFRIWKVCHIYVFDNATLVYYTVVDEKGREDSFIEIELDENKPVTEEEGYRIISVYEAILGLTAQQRMKRSLFEMYSPNEK